MTSIRNYFRKGLRRALKIFNVESLLFRSGNRYVHIHKTVIMWSPENVELHKSTELYEYSIIRATGSKVKIGANTQVGPFTVIFGGSGVFIGDNVMIAPHCVIAGGNHDYKQTTTPMLLAGILNKGPIYIEDDVWIGSNCTITDGVRIRKGSVVAANSLVNKDVNEYDIVGGVPAKVIGNRKNF